MCCCIWSQDVTHALCAKLGNICILFVGIVSKSAFCVIHCLQLDKIKKFNVGKENISKQYDTIHNTNVTKDAYGPSKILILRSILKYIFKSLKASICRKQCKMRYESRMLHYDSGLES